MLCFEDNAVEENMTNVSKNFKEFIKSTFSNIRSNVRTIQMHSAVLEEFLNNYPEYKDYEWKHECFYAL